MSEPNIEALHYQQRLDNALRECETHQDIIAAQTKQIATLQAELRAAQEQITNFQWSPICRQAGHCSALEYDNKVIAAQERGGEEC